LPAPRKTDPKSHAHHPVKVDEQQYTESANIYQIIFLHVTGSAARALKEMERAKKPGKNGTGAI
jgi:hypothetical protein